MASLLTALPGNMLHLKFMRMRPTPEALLLLCGCGVGAATCVYMRDSGELTVELQQRYMRVRWWACTLLPARTAVWRHIVCIPALDDPWLLHPSALLACPLR